jgi:hypothetical protein
MPGLKYSNAWLIMYGQAGLQNIGSDNGFFVEDGIIAISGHYILMFNKCSNSACVLKVSISILGGGGDISRSKMQSTVLRNTLYINFFFMMLKSTSPRKHGLQIWRNTIALKCVRQLDGNVIHIISRCKKGLCTKFKLKEKWRSKFCTIWVQVCTVDPAQDSLLRYRKRMAWFTWNTSYKSYLGPAN